MCSNGRKMAQILTFLISFIHFSCSKASLNFFLTVLFSFAKAWTVLSGDVQQLLKNGANAYFSGQHYSFLLPQSISKFILTDLVSIDLFLSRTMRLSIIAKCNRV